MSKQTKEKSADTVKPKVCFVILPIGEEKTDTRERADSLINDVISPVVEELNITAKASHHENQPGSITDQIIRHLLEAELVVADLTYSNPNVMYELGIRHALGLPVVSIAEKGTKLPFDLASDRTIIFENSIPGTRRLKEQLSRAIKDTLAEEKSPNNPVTRAQGWLDMYEITNRKGARKLDALIVEKFEELTNRFVALENMIKPPGKDIS